MMKETTTAIVDQDAEEEKRLQRKIDNEREEMDGIASRRDA
jgi:hypothetical protein